MPMQTGTAPAKRLSRWMHLEEDIEAMFSNAQLEEVECSMCHAHHPPELHLSTVNSAFDLGEDTPLA